MRSESDWQPLFRWQQIVHGDSEGTIQYLTHGLTLPVDILVEIWEERERAWGWRHMEVARSHKHALVAFYPMPCRTYRVTMWRSS